MTFDPSISVYLADEVDNIAGIFSYGGNLSFEFDLGPRFNLVQNLVVGMPILIGTSTEITSDYILMTSNIMLKYYPTVEAETYYYESPERSVLIEDRKRGILPYVAAGPSYSFFVNDGEDKDFVNLSLVGMSFVAGFDLPVSSEWGFNVFSQVSSNTTFLPPLLIFLQFHTGFGFYYNF